MSGSIHPTAIIASSAKIHPGTTIMPYSYIGEDVEIGDSCEIGSHAVIKGPTLIGKNNRIFQFCSIGEECQHLGYRKEKTHLVIGDNNVFRESCTVHRGTSQGNKTTRVGNNNFFLVNVHIAHDCIVGNNNVIANNSSLGGHVELGNNITLGGHTGIHQYCRIGDYAFIGRCAMVVKDTPPFTLSAGNNHRVYGLNIVGLTRQGFSTETIKVLKKAYSLYYRNKLSPHEALKKLEEFSLQNNSPEVKLFTQFIQSSRRGIVS